MSISGFMKQINKANQVSFKEKCLFTFVKLILNESKYYCFFKLISEKIGGAKGTEIDERFVVMEKVNFCWCFVFFCLAEYYFIEFSKKKTFGRYGTLFYYFLINNNF